MSIRAMESFRYLARRERGAWRVVPGHAARPRLAATAPHVHTGALVERELLGARVGALVQPPVGVNPDGLPGELAHAEVGRRRLGQERQQPVDAHASRRDRRVLQAARASSPPVLRVRMRPRPSSPGPTRPLRRPRVKPAGFASLRFAARRVVVLIGLNSRANRHPTARRPPHRVRFAPLCDARRTRTTRTRKLRQGEREQPQRGERRAATTHVCVCVCGVRSERDERATAVLGDRPSRERGRR